MDEAVEMATALSRAGFSTVYCTPHMVRGAFEVDNATVLATLASLRTELSRNGIDLTLLPGREYYLDEFYADHLKDPLLLGETRYFLVEISGSLQAAFIKDAFFRLRSAGYTPLIAHPERCRLLDLPAPPKKGLNALLNTVNSKLKTHNSEPDKASLLTYLREIGCAFQGNLGSFSGYYGERVRRKAGKFRAAGLYTHYGSDLHSIRQKDILSIVGTMQV